MSDRGGANRRQPPPDFGPVETLTVIVPTLNEAEQLPELLGHLRRLRDAERIVEVIVADAGSSDGTGALAERLGARVVQSPRGRGIQIERALRAASGDLILVLHADCRLKVDVIGRLFKRFEQRPELIGGALGMSYRSGDPSLRLLALLNNARSRLLGLAFGDQGQFFRRRALALIGGYPIQMLMEDVELSLRLKEHGPVCHIPKGIEVSGRRWHRQGFAGNFVRVLVLLGLYLVQRRLGRFPLSDADYYRWYY